MVPEGDVKEVRQLRRATWFLAIVVVTLLAPVGFGLAVPKEAADAATGPPEPTPGLVDDGPISAQASPSVSISAPAAAIGDFGASQNNIWNMDSTGDIVWTQSDGAGRTISLSQLSPGIVRGRAPEGSDLAVVFYASPSVNLPSSQYHHLTYRLKIAAEGDCVTNGRIIYTKVWPNWLGSQVYTHAIRPHRYPMECPFGQFCVYYMDLSSNQNDIAGPDTATWFVDPPLWPSDDVKTFGMWAHERWFNCAGGPDYFDLDYVYLTGDIVAREKDGYTYPVRWEVSDPDGGSIISTIRYLEVDELQLPANSPPCDASNFEGSIGLPPREPGSQIVFLPILFSTNPGIGSRWQDFDPIARVVTSPGTQTYTLSFFDDTKFEDGKSYYLCIRVDDGTSQSYAVSSAPVIRVPHSPNFSDE
jgi:hypothetical protein